MQLKESNKIIAKYMGWEIAGKDYDNGKIFLPILYLDTLIPVWKKLSNYRDEYCDVDHIITESTLLVTDVSSEHSFKVILPEHAMDFQAFGNTPQEAAAIATAKAIKEIEE